jgi:hypothetical protein
VLDQALDAWIGGQRGSGALVGAVQAEHLTGEVVGADGEEVHRRCERRRVRGGRRDLDHDAEPGWFPVGLGGCFGQGGADRSHLVQRADHRYQHGQPGSAARAQDRGELVAQRVRCLEQGDQSLVWLRPLERRDLVAGEVEQADHGRLLIELAEDGP